MKDILVIMGSHPGTRGLFDWTREDCDIVVFNEAMKMDWVKRADYVMQMHVPTIWQNPGNRNDPNHYNWLKSGETPVIWMQEKYDDVPKSKRYPIERVLKISNRKYITSSAAYSIALGIHLGYQKIEIYGVEMATNTEYVHQRPGVAYWIGIADALGVNVEFHGDLMTCPLYGYEGNITFPYTFFEERLATLEKSADEAKLIYNKASEVANNAIAEYMETGVNNKIDVLMQKAVEQAAAFGLQDGARQEILRYKKKADVQIEATGDFLFSRQEFEHAGTSLFKERERAIVKSTEFAKKCGGAYTAFINTQNPGKKKNRLDQFTAAVFEYVQSSTKVGMFDGAMKENRYLMAKLDELIRMAGGAESERVLLEAR